MKIRFTGLVIGWGLDHLGGLWRTRDGGLSFESMPVPGNLPVVDIAQWDVSKKGIWLAHRNGLVRFMNHKAEVGVEHRAPVSLRSLSVFQSGFLVLSVNHGLLASFNRGVSWNVFSQTRGDIDHLSEAKKDGRVLGFDRLGQIVLIDSNLGTFETIRTESEGKWLDAASLDTGWLLAGQRGRVASLNAAHDKRIVYETLNQAWPDLVAYAVRDDGRCWAAFRNGWLWRSKDGGIHWSSLGQPLPAPVARITFPEVSFGYALVGNNSIYKTESGGATWRRVGEWPSMVLNHVFFLDRNLGWVVGNHGCLVRTIDGGVSWTLDRLSLKSSLYLVRFMDEKKGWVLGEDHMVYRSLDGGRSWVGNLFGKGKLFGFYLASSGIGFLVGEKGSILATQDGGQSWEPRPSQVLADLRAIAFLDEQRGLIGGDGGVALQTIDGGETWTSLNLGTKADIYSVGCLPKFGRCLIGGQNGLMLGGEPFDRLP